MDDEEFVAKVEGGKSAGEEEDAEVALRRGGGAKKTVNVAGPS